MKFKISIDIEQARDMVARYFADPAYLKEYQEGFVKKELISGTAGEDGAVSRMYYKAGNRELVLEETITANRLPQSFLAHYHHQHMDNSMKCTFTALSRDQTRYESEIEYTRINWVLPKLMAILFPGMYRSQVRKWMNNFKVFVEKQERP